MNHIFKFLQKLAVTTRDFLSDSGLVTLPLPQKGTKEARISAGDFRQDWFSKHATPSDLVPLFYKDSGQNFLLPYES